MWLWRMLTLIAHPERLLLVLRKHSTVVWVSCIPRSEAGWLARDTRVWFDRCPRPSPSHLRQNRRPYLQNPHRCLLKCRFDLLVSTHSAGSVHEQQSTRATFWNHHFQSLDPPAPGPGHCLHPPYRRHLPDPASHLLCVCSWRGSYVRTARLGYPH